MSASPTPQAITLDEIAVAVHAVYPDARAWERYDQEQYGTRLLQRTTRRVELTSAEKNTLTRVNARTHVIEATIPVGPKPRFLTVGEGGVWTLNQGDGSISRVDPKTNKVAATIEAGVPGGGGEISAGEGSVWVTTFEYPITRIDPSTNKVAQQFFGEGGDSIRAGLGWIWVTNIRAGNVWRLDPKRVLATLAE